MDNKTLWYLGNNLEFDSPLIDTLQIYRNPLQKYGHKQD